MKHTIILSAITLFSVISISLTPSASVILSQTDNRDMQVKHSGQTDQRVALVIGNSAYPDSPLTNPVNDAREMTRALRQLGFEVISGENLSQNEMKRQIRLFGDKIRNGGVGLFYYAGHGIQINGRNYLIPVNATITKEEEVEYESIDLGFLLAQMENARNRLNIVILDACRNNPFARSFRSIKQGLASVDAPSGTLIAYATAPGSVASDGAGKNGLYTQELLKYMRIPELGIEQVFKQVRIAVRDKTQGAQIPWESSSLVGDFYFPIIDSTNRPASPPAQPVTAESYIRKGDVLLDEKKWAEAEDAYRQALAWEPDNVWYRLKLYTSLYMQNKIGQVSEEGKKIIEQKRWGELENEARRLVVENPMSVLAHWQLGYTLIIQKKHAEAEAEFRKAISIDPSNTSARVELGTVLFFQNKAEEAEAEFRKAISIDPINANAHRRFGAELTYQKKYSEAEAEFRKAISIAPNTAILYIDLGWMFYRQQKYTEAEAGFRKAISIDPNDDNSHNRLGDALLYQQKYTEAEVEFRKAISINPNNAYAHSDLGDALFYQNKDVEAEAEFRKAISINPDVHSAHNGLGNLFYRQQKYTEAEAEYRKAISIVPGYKVYQDNLEKLLKIKQ